MDDYLIESMEGARLKLHEPVSAGKVLVFDKPWEGVTSDYISVFKDDDRYRMYYRGSSHAGYTVESLLEPGEWVIPEHDQLVCYAESQDGIHWKRPPLGLFDFGGSKENNIVWTGHDRKGSHCFMAFRDDNPNIPEDQRYKDLASGRSPGWKHVLGLVSPDGIRWRTIQDDPIISQEDMDWGADLAFWDTEQEPYVAYLRDWRPALKDPPKGMRTMGFPRIRAVVRTASADFHSWSPLEFMDLGGAPVEHFYSNGITPYFRAPHIYLAFPRRCVPWRTLEVFKGNPGPGASDVVFPSGRDGLHWERSSVEAFIRPGRNIRSWIHRANTPASGVVPTGEDEVSLYLQRHYTFPSSHFERMALRTEGFVSLHAGYAGGELVTRLISIT